MIECLCDWVLFANVEEVPVRIGLNSTQKRNFMDTTQFERFLLFALLTSLKYSMPLAVDYFAIVFLEQNWLAFDIFFLIHMSFSTICPIIHLHRKHSHFHRRSSDY